MHLVVNGILDASGAIRDFKAYASRELNREGVRRRWARGGNARPLRDRKAVLASVQYVADRQGAPMALYMAPDL